MAYVPIPKDLKRVKTKVAFNLTRRQLIGFSLAGLVGIPTYLLSFVGFDDGKKCIIILKEKRDSISVHATSFLRMEDDKIASMDEYWGDDGEAPKWRLDMEIGKRIR